MADEIPDFSDEDIEEAFRSISDASPDLRNIDDIDKLARLVLQPEGITDEDIQEIIGATSRVIAVKGDIEALPLGEKQALDLVKLSLSDCIRRNGLAIYTGTYDIDTDNQLGAVDETTMDYAAIGKKIDARIKDLGLEVSDDELIAHTGDLPSLISLILADKPLTVRDFDRIITLFARNYNFSNRTPHDQRESIIKSLLNSRLMRMHTDYSQLLMGRHAESAQSVRDKIVVRRNMYLGEFTGDLNS